MDRRIFLRQSGGAAMLALGATTFGRRFAQAQSTPTAGSGAAALAGLGLPELTVTLTAKGFEATPAETPAGWTLVTFENRQTEGEVGPDIMLIPKGETLDSVFAVAATPEAAQPAWLSSAVFAGAPWTPAGKTGQAVVLLEAGDWIDWSGGEALTPAPLTVTAGAGPAAADLKLTADVEVAFKEYSFTGLQKPIPAGPRLWKVANMGSQPHFIIVAAVPAGTTRGQLLAGVGAMMSGTPAPDALDVASLAPAGGGATISPGRSLWLPLDLAAGTYAAVCFFPDAQTDAPHVLLGIGGVFTVAG
ncbi:MAG: hypothetical protein ACR2OO_08785 [Thermomicrobiales bacterium]